MTFYFILLLILVVSLSLMAIYLRKNTQNTKAHDLLQRDLEMAKRVQAGLLDVETPSVPGLKIVKRCIATEYVGGDFYVFIPQDTVSMANDAMEPGIIHYTQSNQSSLGVIVGDVAGHGISSALVMALSSAVFSEVARYTKEPAKLFRLVNEKLHAYIQKSQISHVTAIYVAINPETQTLHCVRAGHPSGVLLHRDGTMELLEPSGVFLGMYPNETYDESRMSLQTGDRLYLYTDGLIEAMNKSGEQVGLDRLQDWILSTQSLTLEESLDVLLEKSALFSADSDRSLDDQTLVIIEVASL